MNAISHFNSLHARKKVGLKLWIYSSWIVIG